MVPAFIRFRFLGLLALAALTVAGAPAAAQDNLDPILAPLEQKGVLVSAQVVRLSDGAAVYSHAPEQLLVPASVAKLFPTAAALSILGRHRTVSTKVLTTQRDLSSGHITDPLYVKGGGDPFLDVAGLDILADNLLALGIRVIESTIVADGSLFRGPSVGPDWDPEDLEQPYGAPASALNLCGNVVTIVVSPSSPGRAPSVLVQPDAGHLGVDNQATTASKTHTVTIARAQDGDRFILRGKVARRAAFCVPVRNPVLFCAAVFKHRMQAKGIQVMGPVSVGVTPAAAIPIAAIESPAIQEIVVQTNKNSVNFAAEVLLRLCGTVLGGPNTAEDGLQVVHQFAASAGAIPVSLADGSGLSRSSRLTSAAAVQLLTYAQRQYWGSAFYHSLPVAGEDGTLKGRMTNGPARGRVMAKTGTLRGVCSLAGYVADSSGPQLAFALVINKTNSASEAKRVADTFATALCALVPAEPSPPRTPALLDPLRFACAGAPGPYLLCAPDARWISGG